MNPCVACKPHHNPPLNLERGVRNGRLNIFVAILNCIETPDLFIYFIFKKKHFVSPHFAKNRSQFLLKMALLYDTLKFMPVATKREQIIYALISSIE